MKTIAGFAPFRVTICGIDELAGHCDAGATHVLSILDPNWPEPEAFGAFDRHHRLELRFHDIIEPQRGLVAPAHEHVTRLLALGRDLVAARDSRVLVHCHAGISRSTAAATLMLTQARPDRPAEEALREVVRLRPPAWPNLRMIEIGDELLGRNGEVVAAVAAHYREIIERSPEQATIMIENGRGREIAAASAG